MRGVLHSYQAKKERTPSTDLATLVLKAMLKRGMESTEDPARFTTPELRETVEALAVDEEIDTKLREGGSWVTDKTVANTVGKLEFTRERFRDDAGHYFRRWVVTREEIAARAQTYGISYDLSLWGDF